MSLVRSFLGGQGRDPAPTPPPTDGKPPGLVGVDDEDGDEDGGSPAAARPARTAVRVGGVGGNPMNPTTPVGGAARPPASRLSLADEFLAAQPPPRMAAAKLEKPVMTMSDLLDPTKAREKSRAILTYIRHVEGADTTAFACLDARVQFMAFNCGEDMRGQVAGTPSNLAVMRFLDQWLRPKHAPLVEAVWQSPQGDVSALFTNPAFWAVGGYHHLVLMVTGGVSNLLARQTGVPAGLDHAGKLARAGATLPREDQLTLVDLFVGRVPSPTAASLLREGMKTMVVEQPLTPPLEQLWRVMELHHTSLDEILRSAPVPAERPAARVSRPQPRAGRSSAGALGAGSRMEVDTPAGQQAASDKRCYACNGTGHLKKDCPTRLAKKTQREPASQGRPGGNKVRIVRPPKKTVPARLGGVDVALHLDTGCDLEVVMGAASMAVLVAKGAVITRKAHGEPMVLGGFDPARGETTAEPYEAELEVNTEDKLYRSAVEVWVYPSQDPKEDILLGEAWLGPRNFDLRALFTPLPGQARASAAPA